jgi:hypothetical protein
MATATTLAPAAVDAATVRRALAKAAEQLRALELPAEAWTLREIALSGLRALATALFTDAHAETGSAGALAGLVRDEVERIAELIAASGSPARIAQADSGRWRR